MAINFPTNPVNGQTFVALGRGWQYNSTSGSWEALIRVNTAFDSDDVVQGTTNLYATNESIDDRVGTLIQAGNNITVNYDDANNQLTLSAVASNTASDLIPDQNNFRDIGSTTLKWKDLHMAGDAVIDGNLTVNGTTTTINSTQLDVDDLNITIASGSANPAAANGAGITVDGASATFTYTDSDDRWNLNKELNVARVHGNLTGNVTGNVSGSAGSVTSLSTNSIGDLSDVDITTNAPAQGNMLVWDVNKFVPAVPYDTGDFNTDFAAKIDTTGITNGQILVYNSSTSKFVAGDGYSTGTFNTDFATKSIHDLSDVVNTGLAGDRVLIYNQSTSKYEPGLISPSNLNTTNSFVDEFTANGGTASFTLSQDPGSKANLLIFVDGVPQLNSNISLSGTSVTLGGTPSNGQIVEARGYGILNNIGAPSDGTVTNVKLNLTYNSDQYTGNGVLVDFTIEAGHTVSDVLVILDGLILPPADYSINGTTLTFGSAPLNGQQIDIRYMPV
tara:strand:+ start:1221 stop:2729 length:1509 start_codon:yes stop_codon:yes gene_type:complete